MRAEESPWGARCSDVLFPILLLLLPPWLVVRSGVRRGAPWRQAEPVASAPLSSCAVPLYAEVSHRGAEAESRD